MSSTAIPVRTSSAWTPCGRVEGRLRVVLVEDRAAVLPQQRVVVPDRVLGGVHRVGEPELLLRRIRQRLGGGAEVVPRPVGRSGTRARPRRTASCCRRSPGCRSAPGRRGPCPRRSPPSRAPGMKSSQFTSGCCVQSVRSTRPGAAASCGSDDPYWYVMSGASPPWRATVSFCSALSLLTNERLDLDVGVLRVPLVDRGVRTTRPRRPCSRARS